MEDVARRIDDARGRGVAEADALFVALVEEFNSARDAAYDARQDLIIQRQAVGFRLENYKLVHQRYPIPPRRKRGHSSSSRTQT